jgi:capsid protein
MSDFSTRVGSFFSSGYDAIKTSGKRKAASSVLKHEEEQLKHRDRKALVSTGRDLNRNYSVVAWAVRKHLDYVSQFNFQSRTGVEEFDTTLEKLMREWDRPANCDVAGRHPFSRIIRMAEARRTIDGDVFLIKRSSGKLQPVEGDLIQDPPDRSVNHSWMNGCKVNSEGRALAWGLHKRSTAGQYEFQKQVRSSAILQHAFFDRFDQVRGISPLAAAFNTYRDCYEGVDYALAKLKVEQLFAMVITDTSSDGMGEHTKTGDGYDVSFGKGPIKLEMDPGDDAKFLTSDNPGSSTQEFLNMVLGMALKSLDIPFSFYREDFTNFFGSKAAFMQYDRSCKAKRDDLQDLLRRITVWRMQLWIQDGELRLPQGMTLRDIPFEWVPIGMPWWDPAKEIKGDLMAIGAGLDSPQRVCRERGRGEWEDNVRQIAKAQAFAEEMGVNITFSADSQPPQEEQPEEVDEEVEEEEVEDESDDKTPGDDTDASK